ncbi:FMN-binding protein [Shewanella sp. 202IG2-18]|uniref:FMN-binding protein n=1 Tax=Parashewanella hymeniacidonis TaxID=2807618 RepID=UPI00195FE886|nr:FMN-binding protein [Parashewanella hymeniacidonis]MBM7073858.1 FMN-binding protein [Parashewanella hymeniacidonis]
MKKLVFFLFLLSITTIAISKEYQSPKNFIQKALQTQSAERHVYWLDDEAKSVIESILGHKFNKLRLRYWQKNNETVWILNEIGKEAPITVGIHVKDNQIVRTKVLVYRESRGDEVRHNFFTKQFIDAKLTDDNKLDRHIDGITGATLSVRALTKLSRIALWLHKKVT